MSEHAALVERRMTEEEFVAWCDEDTHAEWVDGVVLVKEPVSGEHDQIAWWLRTLLQLYVEERDLGRVSGPEFAVRLPRRPSRREPDVVFVAAARLDAVRPNHVEGPPDLVIEVVSPDSQSRDRREKYLEYEAAGVTEYWIADPLSRTIEAYRLVENRYTPIPESAARVDSTVVPGWSVRPTWLWDEPRTRVLTALSELLGRVLS
ncbi:MAG TPA: Uma2 family endonuclease [Candidatus Binatia bacterium]|nr:Uma2 family endonuclease [Candidatus Binatia bacterium]